MKKFGKYVIVFILAFITIMLAITNPISGDPDWSLLFILPKMITLVIGYITYKLTIHWMIIDLNETV